MSNEIVQSLWIGDALTVMERLSLRSFLAHGHAVHLYTYGQVAGVPDGVRLCDGREILPERRIFRYRGGGSYAGFANFFRYQLLYLKGGWWVDTDVACLRPFDFSAEHVFASETDASYERQIITSGVIKAPARSAALLYACRVCDEKDVDRLVWGETGPWLLDEVVRHSDLERFVQPYRVFCPIFWDDIEAFVDPASSFSDIESTLAKSSAVHLWNESWRRRCLDKDASFPAGCLYERLKLKYLA